MANKKVWRCPHCTQTREQEAKPAADGCPNDKDKKHSWILIRW